MNLDKTYFGDVTNDATNRILDASRLKSLADPVPNLEMLRVKISHGPRGLLPKSMLALCYDNLRVELDTLMKQGFAPYVFEQVEPAQENQAPKIKQMNSEVWVKDIEEKLHLMESCFPTNGRISRAALIEISWSSLFDAVLYCNKHYSWTSIFISKKKDFFSAETLEKIIECGNFEIDTLFFFSILNKGAICGGLCEEGTIVIRSDGGFGDRFAEIQMIGIDSSLARISTLCMSILDP